MDNLVSWLTLVVFTMCGAVAFVRYAIASYEEYLYKRRHGWQ